MCTSACRRISVSTMAVAALPAVFFSCGQVSHTLRIVSFLALQLPIFTYLITQFQAVGTEVRTFTQGHISPTAAVLVAAGVLLVCDLMGGMRSVAYTGQSVGQEKPAMGAGEGKCGLADRLLWKRDGLLARLC